MNVEVWFFNTPYIDLIGMRDWKGILLKAHINWLNQILTHCALRINFESDYLYQATWGGILAFETKTLLIKPTHVIDITTQVDFINVIDKLQITIGAQYFDKVLLSNLLHLMYKKPHKVDGILCTSFIMSVLDIDYVPMDLYPDNCYKLIKEYASKGKTCMS